MSFLLSHRYYAGNWAYNVWLFRDDSQQKLKQLTRSAPLVAEQLRVLYNQDVIDAAISKVMAFRFMHLLGGALKTLVPRATDDIERYEWLDGELVAGVVVGWNFGEGHLANRQLLRAVQAQCGFEPGELRVISVESQPIHRRDAAWWITDAATGTLDEGRMPIAQMADGQPWPEPGPSTR